MRIYFNIRIWSGLELDRGPDSLLRFIGVADKSYPVSVSINNPT